MSYLSDSSSGSSKTRKGGGNCVGIPRKCCSCDAGIMTYVSHSKANPDRMFFRCATAASLKLSHDNHTFKWVDKAVEEEVVEKAPVIDRLQTDMCEVRTDVLELQKQFDEYKKTEVCEVRTDVLELQKQFDEYKKTMKIGCGAIVVGCLFVAVLFNSFEV